MDGVGPGSEKVINTVTGDIRKTMTRTRSVFLPLSPKDDSVTKVIQTLEYFQ